MEKTINAIKGYFYKKGITERIVFVISALMIVTTACFIGSVFFILEKQLVDQTQSSVKKDLDMVLEKMDMFFQGVENDAVSVLVGESCQTLLGNSDQFLSGDIIKQHEKYMLIQQVLNSYIGQKGGYGAIAFYDLRGNCYVNESLECSGEYGGRQMARIGDFLASDRQKDMLELHKSPWKKARDRDYADCISYVRKVYSMDSGRLIGTVEIEIPNSEAVRLYETVMSGDIRLYFASGGRIILAGDEELLYQELGEKSWYRRTEDKVGGRDGFLMTEDREAWYVLKDYDGQNWTVISEVAKASYIRALVLYGIGLVGLGSLIFMASLFLVRFLVTSITRPLSRITETMVEIGRGDYDKRVIVKDGGEIGTLALEFNRMVDKTRALMQEIVDKEAEKRESELSLIQMQMTPHFFYNILESICGLIVMDEKKLAMHTIQLLSGFYRGVLNKGKEIITVKQELDIAVNYLEIMKICCPEKFTYEVCCGEELWQNHICKLTLQPLLENAIHHGFQDMERGGRLFIRIRREAEGLIMEVEDNGMGIDALTRKRIMVGERQGFRMESFGLRNTDERIKLYFGNSYGLEILPRPVGTLIRIVLPDRSDSTVLPEGQ